MEVTEVKINYYGLAKILPSLLAKTNISKSQWCILMCIIHYTYGVFDPNSPRKDPIERKKEMADINRKQFLEYTGLSYNCFHKEIKKLKEAKIINQYKYKGRNFYGLNVKITEWDKSIFKETIDLNHLSYETLGVIEKNSIVNLETKSVNAYTFNLSNILYVNLKAIRVCSKPSVNVEIHPMATKSVNAYTTETLKPASLQGKNRSHKDKKKSINTFQKKKNNFGGETNVPLPPKLLVKNKVKESEIRRINFNEEELNMYQEIYNSVIKANWRYSQKEILWIMRLRDKHDIYFQELFLSIKLSPVKIEIIEFINFKDNKIPVERKYDKMLEAFK